MAGAGVDAPPRGGNQYQIPERMQAWVLGDPGQLLLTRKPVPVPAKSEVTSAKWLTPPSVIVVF